MNEGNPHDQAQVQDQGPPPSTPEAFQPGFCSATCTDNKTGKAELAKPLLKTSDLFVTCQLPKRFEHPHWFNGYGCQVSKEHPFYRTSSSEYGWYPPGFYSVPTVFYPAGQRFTNALSAAGMYRNYSLNTGMDQFVIAPAVSVKVFTLEAVTAAHKWMWSDQTDLKVELTNYDAFRRRLQRFAPNVVTSQYLALC